MPDTNWTAIATIILAIATAFNGWALFISSRSESLKAKPKAKPTVSQRNRIGTGLGGWGFRNRYFVVLITVPVVVRVLVTFLSKTVVTPRDVVEIAVLFFLIGIQITLLLVSAFIVALHKLVNEFEESQKHKRRVQR